MRSGLRIGLAVAAWMAIGGMAEGKDPSLTWLQPLETGSSTIASHVSGDGSAVVGFTRDVAFEGTAFRWTEVGGTKKIAKFVFAGVSGPEISEDGKTAVGNHFPRREFEPQAYRWTGEGGTKKLKDPAGDSPVATVEALTADGKTAFGSYIRPTETDGEHILVRWNGSDVEEFLVEEFQFVPTTCSADGSVVIGAGSNGEYLHSEVCRWSEEGGVEALGNSGAEYRYPSACSADATTIVGTEGLFQETRAFRWTADAQFETLASPDVVGDPYSTEALGCSADGSVIVGVVSPDLENEDADDSERWGACVWIDGEPYLLADLLEEQGVDLGDVILVDAVDCSDDGSVIVGTGYDAGNPTDPLMSYYAVIHTDPLQTESRGWGAAANAFALSAYQNSIYAFYEPSGYSLNGYSAYACSLYAYIYGLYAGDTVTWGEGTSRSEVLGEYLQYRYYQVLYDYYAQLYALYRYYEWPSDYSYSAYSYAAGAQSFGTNDLEE